MAVEARVWHRKPVGRSENSTGQRHGAGSRGLGDGEQLIVAEIPDAQVGDDTDSSHIAHHALQKQILSGRRAVPERSIQRNTSGKTLWHSAADIALDILATVIHLLKTPITLLASIAIVILILALIGRQVRSQLCSIPGSSYLISSCLIPDPPTGIQELKRLVNVHEELDRIQELAAGGISLPLLIKRGEAAIREVSKRVELSDLPSRDELVPIFHDFYQLARTVGADVQRFHSHLGRTYDTAIHLSAQTERKLSEIQALESGSETARVSSLLHPSSLLAFFMPASRSSRDIVRTEYLAHLTRLKGSIDTLILENELVVANLDTLEEYLYRIHDLAVTDDHHVHAQHYQLAPGGIGGSLAALFRGRGQALALNRVRDSLDVLDQLRTNRDVASKLVSGSLLQLRGVSRELEDLRVRVVQREVVSEDEAVSLEFQITMIRSSLLRMEMGKQRTRKAKEDFYGGLQRQIDQNFDQRT